MKKRYFLFVSSLLAVVILYLVEQVLEVDYFMKTGVKWVFFLGLPIIYIKYLKKDNTIISSLNLRRLKLKDLSWGFLLGSICFIVIIGTFFLFRKVINVDLIKADIVENGITVKNFIFIGIYISFFNALLEEFFFRGFLFLNLYKDETKPKFTAYTYSSLLFALYHIGIFINWFNIPMILLALLGLLIVGYVFNYVDTKSNNFLNSYVIHILANIAIILIGLLYVF